MYDTPSSRTSKHGAKKAQHRSNRKAHAHSLVSMPVTILPERADPMELPPAEDAAAERELLSSAQLDKLHLDVEPETNVFMHETQEHPVRDVSSNGWGVPQAWNEPHDGSVDIDFDPFIGLGEPVADAQELNLSHDPREAMVESDTPELAPLRLIDEGEDEGQIESISGGLHGSVESARPLDEPGSSPERETALSGHDSPPVSSHRGSGRTRAPILVTRNPTSPSSLSRQLQNVQSLLPASPQLPSFGFSNPLTNFAAPRITNVTVNGSSFNNPILQTSTDPFVSAKEARRRSTGNFAEARDRDRARLKMTPHAPKLSDSDEDTVPPPTAPKHTRYPTSIVGSDKVVFASFAFLSFPSSPSSPRRLLFIGYENGLQIWDTTHLGEVREILNRRISGAVVACIVLPVPGPGSTNDLYKDKRPLIGIIVEEHDACYLLVYSLASHEVVQKLDFSGASVTSLQASNSFIVVSTTSPSSLHILCARTLNILHTIQSRQLSLFARPVSVQTSEGSLETVYSARQDRPHAVFSLSSRLLAFASASPAPESASLSNIYPRMAVPHPHSIQLGPLNVSQADIGNAAMKVGGGLLSGMKTLGGIAVAAARGERNNSASGEVGGGLRKFFSRSAPSATSTIRREREASHDPSASMQTDPDEQGPVKHAASRRESGAPPSSEFGHITVLDLQPLLDNKESGRPERLSEFTMPGGQIVAGLKFSEDGTNLAVIPNDGGVVRLYQIKPRSRVQRYVALNSGVHSVRDKPELGPSRKDSTGSMDGRSGLSLSSYEAAATTSPWHIYDLRRGRTHGIIEAVNYSYDSRWVGVSTRKRTIHLFPTNPYGGKPDEASHMDGRVKNVGETQPLSTEVRPIVRLRSNPVSSPEQLAVPLAFSFISFSETLPMKFLPTHNAFSPPSSVSSSLPSTAPQRRTQSVSPRLPPKPTNYQDILVFDSSDGSLSLRRLTISTRIGETGSSFFASLPIPAATSISLPGVGFMSRPSASPPKAPTSTVMSPTAVQLPTELVAKDSTIATWNLVRDSKWSDVKEPLVTEHGPLERRIVTKSEWLSQAELSTCSRSTSVLPGSVYLSHQFSFFALGEDYHALIRRLHFDIPVEKIEVRREVEANVYTTGHGESFVSAGTSPQDARAVRSLDEPLASAIFSGLDYSGSSPPVIPMLPNGARPGSFKSAIPIRSVAAGLTEGVNESFGRLSRGIKKVRSPRLIPRPDDGLSGRVPLEFDEEDEAFLSQEELQEHDAGHDNDSGGDNDTMSNSGGRDSRSVSTPSTNNNAPLPGSEPEADEWLDNMDAVEEAERFDEISAAGFMDEDRSQLPIRVPGLGQKGFPGRKGR